MDAVSPPPPRLRALIEPRKRPARRKGKDKKEGVGSFLLLSAESRQDHEALDLVGCLATGAVDQSI